MIDTHLHLDLLDRDGGADAALAAAAAVGVRAAVGIGVDPRASSRTQGELTAPIRLYETLGFHPQNLTTEADLDAALAALAGALERRGPDVVAVGETGLDARPGMAERALQERAFRAQLLLAHQHGLPVVLHGVRRDGDMLRVLDEHIARHGPIRGVWHGFSGSRETMQAAVERGFSIAIGFMVVNENARRVREAVPHIPLDRLVVETDAPPFEPARLRDVVDEVARLRGVAPRVIEHATTHNAVRLFGLSDEPVTAR